MNPNGVMTPFVEAVAPQQEHSAHLKGEARINQYCADITKRAAVGENAMEVSAVTGFAPKLPSAEELMRLGAMVVNNRPSNEANALSEKMAATGGTMGGGGAALSIDLEDTPDPAWCANIRRIKLVEVTSKLWARTALRWQHFQQGINNNDHWGSPL